MNTRSTPSRRVQENDVNGEIPPHVEQVPKGTQCAHGDQLPIGGQGNEESKLGRIARNLKKSGSSDQAQRRFKERVQNQYEPRCSMVKFERRGGSQNEKPTCVTCGKRHYRKCVAGTSGFFGCGKDHHKDDAPNKRRFDALRTRGEKWDEDDDE
ncbi:hypothetical protein EJD97_008897 [Solanum chilense]|uniref:Uncharacterized protein n=1 Tax=Solanum chilense TaxID=4083 RepID=A0A6N2BKZ5_SOLCI|nr:hypothetical protein EJD97_008897 [Solanum chilense]